MHRKKNNKGLTLVELIVSIAILAIVVLPLMTAFVVSLRTNAKAKDKLRSVEIARNLLEGMEATNVTDIMTQLSFPEKKFDLLANHDDITSCEVVDNGGSYVKLITEEGMPADMELEKKRAIQEFNAGKYKFVRNANGLYHFFLQNIPSDNKNKRYSAMVTIDSKPQVTQDGVDKHKYNSFSVADMESVDSKFNALTTNVKTVSEVIEDIRTEKMIMSLTEDDAPCLTRTITVDIENPDPNANKTKVTASYSYHCEGLVDETYDEEGNLIDSQEIPPFDFPQAGSVYAEEYSSVIYDGADFLESSDNELKNIYLFYQPWYVSTQPGALEMKDIIKINNPNDYECTVKIVKQKILPEMELGIAEQNYHVRVEVKESVATGKSKINIETNLGTNISDDEFYGDEASEGQAVYIYNNSLLGPDQIYNPANPAKGGTKESSSLWVSTGFGIGEDRDRIFDVKVDVYSNGTNLDDIYSMAEKPIVSLTGGLTD